MKTWTPMETGVKSNLAVGILFGIGFVADIFELVKYPAHTTWAEIIFVFKFGHSVWALP